MSVVVVFVDEGLEDGGFIWRRCSGDAVKEDDDGGGEFWGYSYCIPDFREFCLALVQDYRKFS